MSPFEYLLLFAAVILGLALSDLAISLHRLLGAAARVKWDWLTPLAAVVAFLKIVTQWWSWYGATKLAHGLTYEMFIGVVVSALLLFLVSAAALPDRVEPEGIDLRVYYAGVSRRYWVLFLLQMALGASVSLWAQMQILGARLDVFNLSFLILIASLVLAASLIAVRNRWWQTAGLVAFASLYGWQFFGQTL